MQTVQDVEGRARQGPPKPPRLKNAHKTMEPRLAGESPADSTINASEINARSLSTTQRVVRPKRQLHFRSPLTTRRPSPTTIADGAAATSTTTSTNRTRTAAESPVVSAKTESPAPASRVTATYPVATSLREAARKTRLVHGCTSLMYACQHGDIVAVMEQLRSQPERIRQRDSRNKNALHYCAAQSAQTRDLVAAASIAVAAPELLESADEDGFTPLHLAVIQGNLAMVNLLLANKADVNAVDNEGHSVVHWATVCGEVEALRAVLAAGGNVATPDINGGSPLHYGAQMCGASYDGKLGQAGSSKLAMEILGILLAHPGCSVDVQDKDGRQPLLWAASAGSAKAVIALVKAGARVESADKDGLTALHCAASRGHTECIDTLISLCGAPTDLIDSNGCTALHYAVTLGHADATSRLLDLDADPNRQDRKGRTPAHCGCSKGQFETVKLLKERGANLWLRNAKGDLPVHEAASSGRRELVEWLLEQRPKQVNTTSNDGRSLLHIAATNDCTDMCRKLLDYGADINAVYRNSKGAVITPLDCALQKGHRSTAKFLQSHGGLPATKLRLASRRANPFQDPSTEQVRPLKYAEKEEIHDLRNEKKYVVYLKRSDSDGGGDGSCSCTEQTYRKEQRYAHTCRRHQQRRRREQERRRTSSCGEPKEKCRGEKCNDICRSKSNIEIRRRKSREHYTSSSGSDAEGGGGEEGRDSCENCCYHKRQKQRVIRRRSTSRRSRDSRGSDGEGDSEHNGKEASPEKRSKRAVEVAHEKSAEKEAEKVADSVSRPGSKSSVRSRPQSASRRQTPPTSAGKEGTFIRSPPQSASANELKAAPTDETHTLELTDEEDPANKSPAVLTTQVDVHRGADETSLKLSEELDEKKVEEEEEQRAREAREKLQEEVTEEATKEVDQLLKIAATAVSSESKSSEELSEEAETKEKSESVEEKQSLANGTATEGDSKVGAGETEPDPNASPATTLVAPSLTETPATPMPSPTPSPNVAAPAEAGGPSGVDAKASAPQKTTASEAQISANAETASKETPAVVSSKTAAPNTGDPSTPTATPTAIPTPTPQEPTAAVDDTKSVAREQESRRSFTLLPSDSADDEEVEQTERKSSFQVLKSDESVAEHDGSSVPPHDEHEFSDSQGFKVVSEPRRSALHSDGELSSNEADADGANVDYDEDEEEEEEEEGHAAAVSNPVLRFKGSAGSASRQGVPDAGSAVLGVFDYTNGRKRRLKKRVKSGAKTRGNWKGGQEGGAAAVGGSGTQQQSGKDQDSGFEPSPRAMKSKIPTPRHIYTAQVPPRRTYTTLDGRACSSRMESRKPGDKGACDMSAVTRSIQRNIRRYYMERKIFQHLLELKSLQIRSNKLNEAVLVKRAVDEYHKSCAALGGETGTRLRRYSFSEYTFKNFELFLYETLKSLQKPGTYNFQNINEVYEEAERRLSPDYNAYEKALQCTTKTHRCLHAAHAYTGIPCAAYIPMMNHHTMPKFGFGAYKKTGVGSFYLPKILTSSSGCGGKMALELSHGKSKQLISLPSDKLDSNKRYYVTFTVKESGAGSSSTAAAAASDKQQNSGCCGNETTAAAASPATAASGK